MTNSFEIENIIREIKRVIAFNRHENWIVTSNKLGYATKKLPKKAQQWIAPLMIEYRQKVVIP